MFPLSRFKWVSWAYCEQYNRTTGECCSGKALCDSCKIVILNFRKEDKCKRLCLWPF